MSDHQQLEKLIELQEHMLHELGVIKRGLARHFNRAKSIEISFEGVNMPVTLQAGQTVTASPREKDETGDVTTISDQSALVWVSSDDTIATVSAVDAGGNVTVTGVKAGTTSISVTDPANSLTIEDTITVTPAPATTIEIDWGTPTN